MWLVISTLYVLLACSSSLTTPIHMNFMAQKENNVTYYLFRKSPNGHGLAENTDVVNSFRVPKMSMVTELTDVDPNSQQARSFQLPASLRNKPHLHDIISSVIQQRTGMTPIITSLPLPLEKSNHRPESSWALNNGLGNQHHPQIVSPSPTTSSFTTFNQKYQQQEIRDSTFLQNPGPFQNQQPLPLEKSSDSFSGMNLTNQINTNKEITSLFDAPKDNVPNIPHVQQDQETFSNIDTPEQLVNQQNLPLDTSVSTSSVFVPATSPIFGDKVFANQNQQNSDPGEISTRSSSHQNLSLINSFPASSLFPQLPDSPEGIQDPLFKTVMDTIFPPGAFNMEISEETSNLLSDSSQSKWICYYNAQQSRVNSDSPNKTDSDDPGSYACFSGTFKTNILKHLFDNLENVRGSRVRGGPLFVFQRGHFANQNFHG